METDPYEGEEEEEEEAPNEHEQHPLSDVQERQHFQRIVNAFRYYRMHSSQRVARTESYLNSLPAHHQKLLVRYRHHLIEVKTCIDHNSDLIKLIIKDVDSMFQNVDHFTELKRTIIRPVCSDMEKVQATLKQFVRDWSEAGVVEREQCYGPIVDEIDLRFPRHECFPHEVHILVPGAGLGRLAFEIAKRGYTCEGNEFSLFMLFASNFVLNRCRGVNLYSLHPWIHQFVNNMKYEDQIASVSFPDVDPSDLPLDPHFSMTAGDFLEVYTDQDVWDCVATCFFIDCASNIVDFMETIYKILKPGGIWVNLGPLLYHFADVPGEKSIEPSYEDVINVVKGIGFIVLKEELKVNTTYAQNPCSMLKYGYESVFFVCKKPPDDGDAATAAERKDVLQLNNGI